MPTNRVHQKPSHWGARVFMAGLAVCALTLGCVIALNHPLGLWVFFGLFLPAAAVAAYSPVLVLMVPLALLPLVDLAPWTGWLTFEEFDLILLAMAGGAYLRLAISLNTELKKSGVPIFRIEPSIRQPGLDVSASQTEVLEDGDSVSSGVEQRSAKWGWGGALLAIYALSLLVSISRGVVDAGGFDFGWFQGYDGPMNALRVGKAFFLAALLIPLMLHFLKRDSSRFIRYIGWGFAAGLGAVSVAAFVERLAYTGLLNFSTDYRTTAQFWEMHVGGAALDGWLMLAFPFAIWAYQHATRRFQRLVALGVVALAGYASLTTFSRGVYLGLVMSMIVLGFLLWKRHSESPGNRQIKMALAGWGVAIFGLCILVYFAFTSAGYRGVIALLGLLFVMLSLPAVLRILSLMQFVFVSILALFVGSFLVVGSNFLPKGPYFLYAAIFVSILYFLHRHGWRSVSKGAAVSWAGYVCLLLAALNVAGYWGGVEALPAFSVTVLLLAVPLLASVISKRALWPAELKSHVRLMMVATAVSGIGALFLGGAYMGDRFTTSERDFGNRISHWALALSTLQSSSDYFFGKGVGRFPSSFHFAGPREKITGSYGINVEGSNEILSLVSANHSMSEGDILRVSQRLSMSETGPFEVEFKGRSSMPVRVHLEVCEKHLLYEAACLFGSVVVQPGETGWNRYRTKLVGAPLNRELLGRLRFKVFSIGLVSHSAKVDIDDIVIYDGSGTSLLANGDFSDNMAHWFMTSDRDHMPWHTKSLPVNLLVDQGIVGLAIFALLTVFALGKMLACRHVNSGIAPYVVAGVTGYLIVGLFDSLLDVPRLSFAYYFLILTCFLLSFPVAANGANRGDAR